MRTALLAPAVLLAAACDGDAPAPPPPPITMANPYHQALLEAEELPRFATIRATVDRNGQPCRTVTGAAPQGDYKNLKLWVVRCANERGGTYLYGLFLAPDGNAQVRSCASMPQLGLPACRADLLGAAPSRGGATSGASGD